MRRCAKEKMEQEQQRDGKGLVILLARYGKNPTSPESRETSGDELDMALRSMRERDLNRGVGDEVEAGSGDSITQQEEETELLEQKWIDVTVPLQFFVKDGELSLTASSKAGLLGFYNPCIGEDQTIASARSVSNSAVKPLLYVRYAYDGQVFEATFDDDQVVSLPSRYAQAMGPVGIVY